MFCNATLAWRFQSQGDFRRAEVDFPATPCKLPKTAAIRRSLSIFALLRLLLLIFIVMTVAYIALSHWSRRVRRRRLTEDWTPQDGDLETYITRGLDAYDHSLRRKLILGVYILPLCLIGVIVYLTNFQ